MEFLYPEIFKSNAYKSLVHLIPKDLKIMLEILEKVLRYQNDKYPPGVLIDNVRDHTLRCIHLTQQVEIPLDKKYLQRLLWIHDIPELLMGEITSIEKLEKPHLATEIKIQEKKAIKQLLTIEDQHIFFEFNRASDFMSGKNERGKYITIEAILAKIIDSLEGNLTFHSFISEWVLSDKYDEKLLPPAISLEYTFRTAKKHTEMINNFLSLEYSSYLTSIITQAIESIKKMWRSVPSEKIPREIKVYLDQH